MQKLIGIVGPTAVGKTALSIAAAKEIGGEIISVDSMQIYKHMNIGTAKPTIEERQGVPHHMLDILEPNDSYSVAQFVKDARACIEDVLSRGKIPILVGGTGLYYDSTVNNIEFADTPKDEAYREELTLIALEKGNEHLHQKLRDIDPCSFNKLPQNDVRRVIRALEVHKLT